MLCADIKKLIPLYLDNELNGNELKTVKSHLQNCPFCQKEAGLYQKSWDMLGRLPQIEPRPGYISRFWTKLLSQKSLSEQIVEGIEIIFGRQKPAVVFAFAAAVIIISLLVFQNFLPWGNTEGLLARMQPDELELVSNVELAQNFDIIENIEILEDLEVLENLDYLES